MSKAEITERTNPNTPAVASDMSLHLDQFLNHYHKLDQNHLELLAQMYTNDVLFIDPFHEINGLTALNQYLNKLYQNIKTFRFSYGRRFLMEHEASVYWELHFSHPRINSGNEVCVAGNSHLSFTPSGQVYEHRDYFDSAAMLYRNLPVLKQVISLIEGRLA